MNQNIESLASQIKSLPQGPGVYIFKAPDGSFVYIGKAINLRARCTSYIRQEGVYWKAHAILSEASTVECLTVKAEVDALLLEAELIQAHKPKYNVLLKEGQPFLYLCITSGQIPKLELVRIQKNKGTYFGPFLEKGPVRRLYALLLKTFRLRLCSRQMPQGCLAYHMGLCAGNCRPDFDLEAYRQRVELVKKLFTGSPKAFMNDLRDQLVAANKAMEFEKSREIHGYLEACDAVFRALNADVIVSGVMQQVGKRDLWITSKDKQSLYLFTEHQGILKLRRWFSVEYDPEVGDPAYASAGRSADGVLRRASEESVAEYEKQYCEDVQEVILGFYRDFSASVTVFVDESFIQPALLEKFLIGWQKGAMPFHVFPLGDERDTEFLTLARLMAEKEETRRHNSAGLIQRFLGLSKPIKTIDCFDISHKQGHETVAASVRFENGKPDKNAFRLFIIRTVDQIDDYASLREAVGRKYAKLENVPDLVVIDGGKGQLNAVKDLYPHITFVSLAKREETIFSDFFPEGKRLDPKTLVGQIFIALRDYTHHRAISFHRKRFEKIKPSDEF